MQSAPVHRPVYVRPAVKGKLPDIQTYGSQLAVAQGETLTAAATLPLISAELD